MKKEICRLMLGSVLTAGLLLIGVPVFAQDAAPSQPEGAPAARRGPMTAEQDLTRMTKRYDLSSDQQSQIKPLLEEQHKKMDALRQDSSVSGADRRTQMMSIRSDSNGKIRAILNPDQQKKFDADQERQQQRGAGGGGGGAEGGAPPQQ